VNQGRRVRLVVLESKMIIGDMEIRLRADIARLQRDMDSARQVVGNATAGMERAATAAKAALAGIAAGFGVQQFAGMVDEYVKFTSQLKLATQSQREYNAAYADVKRISSQATQGLQETGVLYARISNGVRELGVSQKQVAAITETVNLSLLVSGATASEAASAQLQLSQAFASGTLRGEEFNAVNEAAPRVMLALADGIGVPVGALKKMAEEGQITSEIMASVLPKALDKLREEAKNIQTISGSFTVLKNNVIEFVGSTAQSSGAVSAISTALSTLANNLTLVAGALVTVAAVKIVSFFDTLITRTAQQAQSNRMLVASNLATAQANATATAQASLLANARLAEIRAATIAADSNIRLALTTNGLIPAQTAATVAAAAHTRAMNGLVVAQAAAAVGANRLKAATAFLGGPIGVVITALGLAATGWSYYQQKQEEANERAAADTKASTAEVTASLEKQNEKLRERLKLQQQAGASDELLQGGTGTDQLAETLRDINELKARGANLDASDQIRLISLQGLYNGLNKEMTDNLELKRQEQANGQAAKALVDIRERLNGVNGNYLKDLGLLQAALNKGAIGQAEYTDLVSKLARETYKSSEAGKAAEEQNKKLAASAKEAADEAEKQANAYRDLVFQLSDRVESTAREALGLKDLTSAEKAHLDLTNDLARGKIKLTQTQEQNARSLINEASANERLAASNREWEKLQQKLTDNATDLAQERYKLIDSARAEADQNEKLVQTFGMTEAAIIRLQAARLMEQETQRLGRELSAEEIEDLQRVIDLKERSANAVASRAELEKTKDFWTDIEKTAHDTFVSIQDGSKNMFQRMKDAAKNTFFDWLYQMTLKKWIINISAQTSSQGGLGQLGGLLGGAEGGSGGAGSIFSNASNLVSMGKTIYSGFTGGIASTLGGWASSAGTAFGSSAMSSFGAGLSAAGGNTGMAAMYASAQTSGNLAAGASAGMSAGTYAIPIAGWIAAGMALSNNLYKQGWDANNGTVNSLGKVVNAPMFLANNILKGIGLSDSAANIFAGMGPISKLFGRKNPEIEEGGVRGLVSASGFAGENYAKILEKGGWFRSDKRYTQTSELSAEQQSGFSDSTKALMDAARGFASTLGIEANVIDGYNKQIKLQLGADEEKNKEAIATLFGEIGDDLSLLILPSVASFSAAGESVSATLQRLVSDYATIDEAFTAIGVTFGAAGVSSLGAREQFLAAAGGVEAFATSTAFFHQNFLSEAERNAPVMKAVTEQMAALGLASVDTREEFKDAVLDLVNSGALTTEEGAKRYAALMKVQEGFAQVYPEIDKTASALQTAAAMLELQAQIYELTGDKAGAASVLAQQHAAALAALDPALRGATQQLWDLQAAAKATEQVKAAASVLLGGVDGAFSALQNVVAREKAAVQSSVDAHTASVTKLQSLSQSLRSTLDSMQSPEQKLGARAEGQAQLRAALAIAQAGGPLPAADSLKNALAAVQQDASSQFSSYTDYLRDLYKTQNDIGELAGITDSQLSVEEKALKAAQDQLETLDGVLKNAQALIDETKGQSTTLLSIEQGIRALHGAVAAANTNPVVSAGAAINNAYQQHLGRAPDAAGFEWWQNAAAGGTPIGTIVGGIASSTEADLRKLYQSVLGREPDAEGLAFWKDAYGPTMSEAEKADWMKAAQKDAAAKKIPGFANGGDFAGGIRAVGEVGVEIEATGPSRIHSTQSLMDALRNPPRNDNAALVTELRAVRTELELLRSEVSRGADGAVATAEVLDKATLGGGPMMVEIT